ncbi:MAG: hypothetical protein K2Q34_01455 [Alphaproteobacteria bacterium]|nr:hypothetical protein [Alphaproteobacteria bacterium]
MSKKILFSMLSLVVFCSTSNIYASDNPHLGLNDEKSQSKLVPVPVSIAEINETEKSCCKAKKKSCCCSDEKESKSKSKSGTDEK